MVTVSDAFKTAAKATARRIFSRVKINFTDLFLDPTATAVLSDTQWLTDADVEWFTDASATWDTDDNKASGSYEDQLVNGRRGATRKWASMDGVTLLDGTSFYAPGTTALASFNEIGWWGNEAGYGKCGFMPFFRQLRNFKYDQVVSIEFSSRNITRMDLAADDKRGEWPVNFSYKFYDGSDNLLDTYSVMWNGSAFRSDNIAVNGVAKITLSISKWSSPDTNVKITELSSNLEQIFEDDITESIQITEQREISNDNSIPAGNIAAAEGSFSFINENRQFDTNNQLSPFYGTVRPGSRVRAEIGVQLADGTVEYVEVFAGWSVSWSVPEKSLTASTTARDRLDLLTRTEIEAGAVVEDDTFSDWFKTVFNDAGLSSAEYEIDSVLDGTKYIVPYGWLDKQTHRAALELLARGCSASVYQDRDGLIRVEAWDYLQRNKTTSEVSYTRADYTDKDDQPDYKRLANKIKVTTQPRVAASSSTVYETSASELEDIDPSTSTEYTVTYEDTPVINGSASVYPAVTDVTVTDATYYSWGAVIEVTNDAVTGQQFQLKVTGEILEVQGRQTVQAIDQTSIDTNGEYLFTFPDNVFLQKRALALDIADGLIDIFAETQRDITMNLSPGGSPALELGDKIDVTDKYKNKEYNITQSNLSYDGGLSIQHKGRIVKQFEVWLTDERVTWITDDSEDWLIDILTTYEPWFTDAGAEWLTDNNDDWSSDQIVIT